MTMVRAEESPDSLINDGCSIVTAAIGSQLFGFPILSVNDAIKPKVITPVPRARPEIAGLLNLRGRVVTAICMRRAFGLADNDEHGKCGIVCSFENEWFSLLFDRMGDVIPEERLEKEPLPARIERKYGTISDGIVCSGDEIIVMVSIPKLVESIS